VPILSRLNHYDTLKCRFGANSDSKHSHVINPRGPSVGIRRLGATPGGDAGFWPDNLPRRGRNDLSPSHRPLVADEPLRRAGVSALEEWDGAFRWVVRIID
jgi:hypothetical protein